MVDIKLNLEEGVKLVSNFKSAINLDDKDFKKHFKLIEKFELSNQIRSLDGDFNNVIF